MKLSLTYYSIAQFFRGGKATVFEGGVRVPGFIHGPKHLFAQKVEYNGLFHVSDFYPTILDMVGKGYVSNENKIRVMDGISQYDTLKHGTNVFPRRSVHIHR